jgi:hypothetical protein
MREIVLPPLFGNPLKAGTPLSAEIRADGSVVLRVIEAVPDDPDVKAAYQNGVLTGASEAIELLAARTEGGKVLRPFAMNAYTGAAMRLPGFFRPVVIDLAGMVVPSKGLPILRGHDPERIVAHTEDVEVSAQRIRVSGVMSGVGLHAQEVLELADRGFPWQASVGASVERMEFVDAGATVKVNGRNVAGPVTVARQSTLREISFVPLGADPGTSAKVGEEK